MDAGEDDGSAWSWPRERKNEEQREEQEDEISTDSVNNLRLFIKYMQRVLTTIRTNLVHVENSLRVG